ncbi:MAG: AMP-binding protein [Candidatus Promineifilaceae bacterium]|nr:AMP-binding protein [Candidatus Promineifilaceae bacterium]
MTHDTIIHRLQENGRIRPNAPAYFEKVGSAWVPTSWQEYVGQVRQAARALMTLGVEPEGTVSILGFNRPEWSIVLLATMSVRGAGVGIYTTNSPQEVQYIVDHAESSIILLENEHQWNKINEVRDQLPHLRHAVMMRGVTIDDPLVLSWEDFLAKADETEEDALDERIAGIEPEHLASLIYTSGTTGPPKGVMLSHDNLAYTSKTALDMFAIGPNDRLVSYLPMSHIAEQMFTVHGGATAGFSVYYAESLDKLADNLREVQPTVLFGVPRIWERFYNGVTENLGQATGARAKIASWAMDIGRQVSALKNKGQEPSGLLALQYKLADRLVYSKVKPLLGLRDSHMAAVGAAPINQEILEFFSGLDVIVYEVYGQSEGCGPTTWNRPGATKFDSTGQAFPGTQVKLAEDGEILLKGRNVFMGYYRNPEATAETLIDGWLYSGDLGRFDEDGHLYIVGRKKEIIITSGGKNIAPKNIEAALKNLDLVAEAVVIGERRKFLSALITLEEEPAQRFAAEHNLEGQELHTHPVVIAEIQRGIDEEVNPQFARVENIRKFTILSRNLTIDDGELTPTLKIKRHNVNKNFSEEIEAMYAGLD